MSAKPLDARSARVAVWLLACAPTALMGCAGDLEDPSRFGPVPLCRQDIDVEQLLRTRCGSSVCHGNGSGPAADLDLVSPGLTSRLVDVPATQCEGRLRISPDEPQQSFLLSKLVDPPAGCGSRMPLVGYLTEGEIGCVAAWIDQVASAPLADGGLADAGPEAGAVAGPSDGGP